MIWKCYITFFYDGNLYNLSGSEVGWHLFGSKKRDFLGGVTFEISSWLLGSWLGHNYRFLIHLVLSRNSNSLKIWTKKWTLNVFQDIFISFLDTNWIPRKTNWHWMIDNFRRMRWHQKVAKRIRNSIKTRGKEF